MSAARPRILVLSGVQGDTRRYRTHHLWEQLVLARQDARLGHITQPDILRQAEEADLLIVHRLVLDRFTARMLETARRRGAALLADVDDLVFDPQAFDYIDSPDFADPTRARLYRENMRRAAAVLEQSSGVLASTAFLAERVAGLGLRSAVHRNGFSLEMQRLADEAGLAAATAEGTVNILYASGTRTHDRDFGLVRGPLQRLLERRGEVRLRVAGPLDPGKGWEGFGERFERLPFRPWRDLPRLFAAQQISLAPLVRDNPFSQSKSEIKWMEAGLQGLAVAASPSAAFQDAIRPGVDGLLAGDEAEWEAALEALAGDAELRERLGSAARERVRADYSPWKRAQEIVPLLNGLLEGAGARLELPQFAGGGNEEEAEASRGTWSSAAAESHPTLWERGLHTLRSRGAGTLAGEVWIYLRRLAAPVIPFGPRR